MADLFNFKDMLNSLDSLTPEQRKELLSRLGVSESGHTKTEETEKKVQLRKNEDGLWCHGGRILSCRKCGSVNLIRHGSSGSAPRLRCKDCGATILVSAKNIQYRSRLDEQQWLEILRGMVENLSLSKIAANTGVSTTTVWNVEKKIKMLVAKIFGQQDCFVDIAECDEYSVHMSFKGKRDPKFFIYILGRFPRHHRTRAEKIEYLQKNGLWEDLQRNPEQLELLLQSETPGKASTKVYLTGTQRDSVSILTGIDRSGNIFAKPVCLGTVETYHIQKHFDKRFASDAIMVTDKNNSYDWFAEERNLHHEKVLAEKHANGPYSLARVNALHSNLSSYWPRERENLPATKYLDVETTFFWWLEKNKDLSTNEKVQELLSYIDHNFCTFTLDDWQDRPMELDTKGLLPQVV